MKPSRPAIEAKGGRVKEPGLLSASESNPGHRQGEKGWVGIRSPDYYSLRILIRATAKGKAASGIPGIAEKSSGVPPLLAHGYEFHPIIADVAGFKERRLVE